MCLQRCDDLSPTLGGRVLPRVYHVVPYSVPWVEKTRRRRIQSHPATRKQCNFFPYLHVSNLGLLVKGSTLVMHCLHFVSAVHVFVTVAAVAWIDGELYNLRAISEGFRTALLLTRSCAVCASGALQQILGEVRWNDPWSSVVDHGGNTLNSKQPMERRSEPAVGSAINLVATSRNTREDALD